MTLLRPTPTFLGYCAKRLNAQPEWLRAAGVQQIASVSECISARPRHVFERWDLLNPATMHDTPGSAWAVHSPGTQDGVVLLAYWLFPFVFDDGENGPVIDAKGVPEIMRTKRLRPEPMEQGKATMLGYDVVCASPTPSPKDGVVFGFGGFSCSPLSCNSAADRWPVNRWCLLDQWDNAVVAALSFRNEPVEQGPYMVLEVHRVRSE